ncbi:MAG: hypothetical protein WAP52_03930, partial [Candidatus Sungiibacteriota bacterium]
MAPCEDKAIVAESQWMRQEVVSLPDCSFVQGLRRGQICVAHEGEPSVFSPDGEPPSPSSLARRNLL